MQASSHTNHIDKTQNTTLAKKGFTLVELLVSIIISVLLLGGIFYFMSDTILGIAKASAHTKFLKDFYGFTTILNTGNIEIIRDYAPNMSPDVILLTTVDNQSGIMVGIVDTATLRLNSTGSSQIYKRTSLGYRSLSAPEIVQLQSSPDIAYTYNFFPDKVFSNFYMNDFQVQQYNSGALTQMLLTIFSHFNPSFEGLSWSEVPQDELFQYSLTF